MPRMTEQEAWELEKLVTKNPPKVDPSKARHVCRVVPLDDLSADYIISISLSNRKTPTEVISDMVRERIAAVG